MNCNQLPVKYSLLYRLVKLIKRDKAQPVNVSEYSVNELKEILIERIQACQDAVIQKLFSDLKPYKESVNIYLHGSWADNSKTPFSDLDDFLVLDTDKLNQNGQLKAVCKLLNKIDMKFCRLDPIQHHGHWIACKNDLNNYDNSFMPLHILKESKVILGNNFISGKVNTQLSKEGLKRNIISTCNGIKLLSDKFFENSINSYQLKGLVGSFVLMPAFIMQTKGFDYTKPEAINEAKSIFTNDALSCIEWSTNNRNNWDVITGSPKFKLFGLLTYFCFDPHLWRRFSKKFSPKIKQSQVKALSKVVLTRENVNLFIEESLRYAK